MVREGVTRRARESHALHSAPRRHSEAARGGAHDGLERVLGGARREQLGRRHVEASQVVLDVVAHAQQRRAVEGAALAHERRLLDERLGLGDLRARRHSVGVGGSRWESVVLSGLLGGSGDWYWVALGGATGVKGGAQWWLVVLGGPRW